jgi:hypothetical protein
MVYWLACLPLDPRFPVSNPAEGEVIRRAIKTRSTPSFGWEVKPSAPCRKILRHVKDPFEVAYTQRYFVWPNLSFPLPGPNLLLDDIAGTTTRTLVNDSGIYPCRSHSIIVPHAHISLVNNRHIGGSQRDLNTRKRLPDNMNIQA